MVKNSIKIIISIMIVAVLTACGAHNTNVAEIERTEIKQEKKTDDISVKEEPEQSQIQTKQSAVKSAESAIETEIQTVPEASKKPACLLSIRCDTILKNLDALKPEKINIVPKDGIVFAESAVEFNQGESVFDILLKVTQENKIHFEYTNTPAYNSTYIEGIANIYELDCGNLSGWLFKVNGQVPGYSCSQYTLKQGDRVEFIYTCDSGKDISGEYPARNGN